MNKIDYNSDDNGDYPILSERLSQKPSSTNASSRSASQTTTGLDMKVLQSFKDAYPEKIEGIIQALVIKTTFPKDRIINEWNKFQNHVNQLDFLFGSRASAQLAKEITAMLGKKLVMNTELECETLENITKKIELWKPSSSLSAQAQDEDLLEAFNTLVAKLNAMLIVFLNVRTSIESILQTMGNRRASLEDAASLKDPKGIYENQSEMLRDIFKEKKELIKKIEKRMQSDSNQVFCSSCMALASSCYDVSVASLQSSNSSFHERTNSFKENINTLDTKLADINKQMDLFKSKYNYLFFICLQNSRNSWKNWTFFESSYQLGGCKYIDMGEKELEAKISQTQALRASKTTSKRDQITTQQV